MNAESISGAAGAERSGWVGAAVATTASNHACKRAGSLVERGPAGRMICGPVLSRSRGDSWAGGSESGK